MDDERPFRLHPRRPRPVRSESKVWAHGFQQLMHLVRMTTKAGRAVSAARVAMAPRPMRMQRCAVRVTYTKNKVRGQWAAHGRYLVRDSATALFPDGSSTFGSAGDGISIPELLGTWQRSGDQRLFKLILSPEFGERFDLERLTADVMTSMEMDLGRNLEWAAVIHRNTDHPHVHVVLRGIADGEPFLLPREFVRRGIRGHAEAACTRQLGYRTSLDMEEAERREVNQPRFTSLDRVLARQLQSVESASPSAEVVRNPDDPRLSEFARAREHRLVARLNYLNQVGLAESSGPLTWQVRRDFETALRSLQKAHDRQKMLGQYEAFLSDARLKFRVVAPGSPTDVEGRIIAHVLDDVSDQPHVIVEGTNGVVYYLAHDWAIAEARAHGRIRPNSFVQICHQNVNGKAVTTVEDLGDAEALLSNADYWSRRRRRPIGVPFDQKSEWSGWLGRYCAALQSQVVRGQSTLLRGRHR